MSNSKFGWESLLHTDAPSACPLKAALFTTYDRADERLLAEHVLPMLLKLSGEPGGEGTERYWPAPRLRFGLVCRITSREVTSPTFLNQINAWNVAGRTRRTTTHRTDSMSPWSSR